MTKSLFLLALALPFSASLASRSQAAPLTPDPLPPVPTTRVLAIGRLTPGTERAAIMPVMKQEVPDTLRLYLSGKIDQWFSMKNQNGVVFILNVTSVEEAHALLEKLPLGEKKMMAFELIPLGPLSPLGLLLPASGTGTK